MEGTNPNDHKSLTVFADSETSTAFKTGHSDSRMNPNPKQCLSKPLDFQETPQHNDARNEDRKEICTGFESPEINPKLCQHVENEPRDSEPSRPSETAGADSGALLLAPVLNPKDDPVLFPAFSSKAPITSLGRIADSLHLPGETGPSSPYRFHLSPKDDHSLGSELLYSIGSRPKMRDGMDVEAKQRLLETSAAQNTAEASTNAAFDLRPHCGLSSDAQDPSQKQMTAGSSGHPPNLQAMILEARAKTYKINIVIFPAPYVRAASAVPSTGVLPNTSTTLLQSSDSEKVLADENNANDSSQTDQNSSKTTIGDSLLAEQKCISEKVSCSTVASLPRHAKEHVVHTGKPHGELAAPSSSPSGSHDEEFEEAPRVHPSISAVDTSAVTAQSSRRRGTCKESSRNPRPTRAPRELAAPVTAAKASESPRESCVQKHEGLDLTRTPVTTVTTAAVSTSHSCQQTKHSSPTILHEVTPGSVTTANSSANADMNSETIVSSLTISSPPPTSDPSKSDKTVKASCYSLSSDGEASEQNGASTGRFGGGEFLDTSAETTSFELPSSQSRQESVSTPCVNDIQRKRPVMVSEHCVEDYPHVAHSVQTVQSSVLSSPLATGGRQASQTSRDSDGPPGETVPSSRPYTVPEEPALMLQPVWSVRAGKLLRNLEKKNAALRDKRTCKICSSSEWDHVLVPCGHLLCLECRFQVVDGKCPFCRQPNSYVVKVLAGNEGLPNATLDLFTPTGDGSPTLMMPPQRTADDQLLTDLPQDLRRNTAQSREDFQRPGTEYASRTQLLDLSLQLGRGKVPAVLMMGTLECRRESLRLFQPQTQDPLQLAEAGLFGDRRQDHPQCFHCAGHVVAEGDPVTSHAQQFPRCRYLGRLLPCPRFPEFRKRRYSL